MTKIILFLLSFLLIINLHFSTVAQVSKTTDFENESTPFIANILHKIPASSYKEMAPSGAYGINALWEQNKADNWYIEAQKAGERAILAGLIKNHQPAIKAGLKMFDWGFAHQQADGGFGDTGDAFHSTSFFVAAVARTLLIIQQTPQAQEYLPLVAHYQPLLHRAARWMIQPEVWKKGVNNNQPYTHRFYLVATALGLTSKLTGDLELMQYAQNSLEDGLSRQLADGVNPEKGGYDSSYQMAGVVYAAYWVAHLPEHPLTPKVTEMIEQALAWKETRILPSGEINNEGDSRTGGQEISRTGASKNINHRLVMRGFAYWGAVTGNKHWEDYACSLAFYYYKITC